MSGAEADAALANAQAGTFLIRPSSQPQHLAVSYVDNGEVQKALISYNVQATKFWMAVDPDGASFDSLDKLVASLDQILRFPLTK